MSTDKSHPRPRQVTTAGVMGVVGSLLLVLSLFDTLQRLKSVEMRSAVEEFLAEPPGNGLGVSTGAVLDLLHGVVLFSGALAAVTAVFAVYVVQRHQAARIGFSVAAALLLFTSPLSGGVMAMIVAFAATMLWSQPARDWFAGRAPAAAPAVASPPGTADQARRDQWAPPVPPAAGPGTGSAHDETREPGSVPGSDPSAGPDRPAPAAYPFGSRPDPTWAPPGFGERPAAPPWEVGTAADPDRRPPSVAFAAGLTWVFAGGTALVYLLVVLMLMFAQQPLLDAIQADPQLETLSMSTDDLLAVLWVMSAVSIFWSLSAVTLAVLAYRRVGWARYALVFSSAVTMLVSLVAFPFGLLHAVAAGVTLPLLLGRRAGAWYARRPAQSAPPPSWPPQSGPPQSGPPQSGPPTSPQQPGPPYGTPPQPGATPQGPPPGRQKPPVW